MIDYRDPFPLSHDIEEILDDLEAGKSRPFRKRAPNDPVPDPRRPRPRHRPTLGGPAMLATWVAARSLGRVHPRLARRALARLWFTPWVSATSTTEPEGARPRNYHAGGRDLSGYQAGDGPAVLAVHGWGGRAADMAPVAADLAEAGFGVVVPDLPGHGASQGRQANLEEIGHAIADVVRAIGPVRAVVTHSAGFGAAVLGLSELAATGHPLPQTVVAIAGPRRMESAFERFVARSRLRPALARELRTLIQQRFGDDIWTRLDAASIAGLGVDGVIIHDTEDREIPYREAVALADRWPAELHLTDGLGHRRILADPDVRRRVVRAVREQAAVAG